MYKKKLAMDSSNNHEGNIPREFFSEKIEFINFALAFISKQQTFFCQILIRRCRCS